MLTKDAYPPVKVSGRDCSKNTKHYKFTKCGSRLTPIEPWAYIRVKNEITTLKASIESIAPVIKKGIIAYSESTDGTIQYLEEFCKKNPGYRIYKYPYKVCDVSFPDQYREPHLREQEIDHFYNFALSKIPINDWLLKIDLDQVYDTGRLVDLMRMPETDDDVVCLVRFNVHHDLKSNSLKVVKSLPYNPYCDHWMLRRTKDFKFWLVQDYLPSKKYTYWHEHCRFYDFNWSLSNNYFTEASSWHFPYAKKYRQNKLDSFMSFRLARWWLKIKPKYVPPEFFDYQRVMDIVSTFNYSNRF